MPVAEHGTRSRLMLVLLPSGRCPRQHFGWHDAEICRPLGSSLPLRSVSLGRL